MNRILIAEKKSQTPDLGMSEADGGRGTRFAWRLRFHTLERIKRGGKGRDGWGERREMAMGLEENE